MDCDNRLPCKTVAHGSVGETGASTLLIHTLDAEYSKMMVVRNKASSLCPNTGAVALLVINGEPVASGDMSAVGSSIAFEAMPDDHVVAIVHTLPLFNDVMCVRLGDLDFILDECDLV